MSGAAFGKYHLIASLGQGGMADVYLAAVRGPAGFRKLVVIKRLREDVSEQVSMTTMLLDEAQLAARLQHPNVVQTFEVGAQDGKHYLAMEYLEGQSFGHILRVGGRPDPAFTAHVMGDALSGLHYAHELCDYDGRHLAIVHRDVSPQNLFVTYAGETKVVDFGIAQMANKVGEKTEAGVLKGKLAYMTPEQIHGTLVDRRTDVFAAGIVMWELLTGQRLFKTKNDGQAIAAVLYQEIPRPSQLAPGTPLGLEAICLRALEREPSRRWQTAEEMREALYEYVESSGGIRRDDAGRYVAALFEDKRAEVRALVTEYMARAEDRETEEAPASPRTVQLAGGARSAPPGAGGPPSTASAQPSLSSQPSASLSSRPPASLSSQPSASLSSQPSASLSSESASLSARMVGVPRPDGAFEAASSLSSTFALSPGAGSSLSASPPTSPNASSPPPDASSSLASSPIFSPSPGASSSLSSSPSPHASVLSPPSVSPSEASSSFSTPRQSLSSAHQSLPSHHSLSSPDASPSGGASPRGGAAPWPSGAPSSSAPPWRWFALGASVLFVVTAAVVLVKRATHAVEATNADAAAPAAALEGPVLTLRGSGTLGVVAAPALVEGFFKQRGAVSVERAASEAEREVVVTAKMPSSAIERIVVKSEGTSGAFHCLLTKTCDIAMAAREIGQAEAAELAASGLGDMHLPGSEHVIALDGIAIVVHPNNPVRALERAKLASIFSGELADWAAVGGAAGPIEVLAHEEGSGTADIVRTVILGGREISARAQRLPNNARIADGVAWTPNAIGFVGLAFTNNARALAVSDQGITPMVPTSFTVTTEAYLLSRRLYMYTPAQAKPLALELLAYVRSNEGQKALRAAGFIGLDVSLKNAEPCPRCPPRYVALTKHARRLSLDFRFRPGTRDLDTRAVADLDRVVRFVREQAAARILLIGFSEPTRTPRTDHQRAKDLAHAVDTELAARGLHATLEGLGGEMPLATGDADAARTKNRRVEIWLESDPP